MAISHRPTASQLVICNNNTGTGVFITPQYATATTNTITNTITIQGYYSASATISTTQWYYPTNQWYYYPPVHIEVGGGHAPCFVDTPEQRAHREAQLRQWQAEQAKRDADRTAAEKRAAQLFIDIFGEIAFRRFEKLGYHEMVGISGKLYRMRPGQKIEVVKDGKTDHRLCVVHPFDAGLPSMDTMIAQALMLSTGDEGEKELVKVGVKWAA